MRFRLVHKDHLSPMDVPLGQKWDPPSRLAIDLSNAEGVYYVMSPLTWAHLMGMFLLMSLFFIRTYTALFVLVDAVVIGTFLALLSYGRKHPGGKKENP